MSESVYRLPIAQRAAFRRAIADVRDGHPTTTPAEAAFLALEIERPAIERTHTTELHARVADRLALTPEADRTSIEAALFGGALPCP